MRNLNAHGIQPQRDAHWDLPGPMLYEHTLKRGEGDAVIASMLIPSQGRDSTAGEGVIFSHGYYSTPGRFAARRRFAT